MLNEEFPFNESSNKEHFVPSVPILKRVMKVLLDNATVGRTRLAQTANVHYGVLQRHLRWLEQKQYIEFTLMQSKAVIRLTESGRTFAAKLFEFCDSLSSGEGTP